MYRAVNKARELAAAKPTDSFVLAFRTAVLVAARRMRELFTVEQLQRAIATRNAFPFTSDHRWQSIGAELTAAVEDALRTKVAEAGQAELQRIARSGIRPAHNVPRRIHAAPPVIIRKADEEEPGVEIDTSFELRNPFSEDFVRRRGAELVGGITDAARERIREVIESGFVDGQTVQQTATALIETLGLDARLSRAVENQIMQLTNAGSSADVVSAQAASYAERLLSYRADLIARTETMTASNQGVMDSWRQATTEGLLPGGMLKQWIHGEGSARTCPICDELGNSDPIPIFEQFYSEELDDYFEAPPAHPACRCTMGLVSADE